VADLTYVKTHTGWVYAAFIIDVFSRIVVGWQLSNSLRSDLAIDALEMAIWNRIRQGQVLDVLIHHSDRGVQAAYRGRARGSAESGSTGSRAPASPAPPPGVAGGTSGAVLGRAHGACATGPAAR
jgi:putative transposase